MTSCVNTFDQLQLWAASGGEQVWVLSYRTQHAHAQGHNDYRWEVWTSAGIMPVNAIRVNVPGGNAAERKRIGDLLKKKYAHPSGWFRNRLHDYIPRAVNDKFPLAPAAPRVRR